MPCSWCCFLGLLKASLLQLQTDGEITRSTCQNYQCAEKKTSNAAQNEKMDLCSGKKRKKRTSWEVFSSAMAVFWQAGSSLLAWLGSAESQL